MNKNYEMMKIICKEFKNIDEVILITYFLNYVEIFYWCSKF